MISSMRRVAGNVLRKGQGLPFIKTCIDKILNFFNQCSGFLLESIKGSELYDTDDGLLSDIFLRNVVCMMRRVITENEILDQVLKIIDITYKATDK